ncbi:hypothetical protein ACTMTF_11855 [Nonomuraea sp. ZG12]|uniref:hypothetical protein n=1 Tax=Nonomuraea sp. ZG12 TaxID=3452207 RepID=UPI003F89904E
MRRALLAAALITLVAACGNQPSTTGVASVTRASGTPATSASPTASTDPAEQGRKFAQCMRDNGIDMPDPDPADGNVRIMTKKDAGKGDMKKAMEACRSLAPFKDRKELTPEDQEKMREFARCMRDNGVDMPDPDPDGGAVRIKGGNGIKPGDPTFQKAMEACRDMAPLRGGRK